MSDKPRVTIEVVRGREGLCLAINDYRVAGPKPWGGGSVIHAWTMDLADLELAVARARLALGAIEPVTREAEGA